MELTAEEKTDWDYFLNWYESNGWTGDDARQNAWTDLRRKYPRLGK